MAGSSFARASAVLALLAGCGEKAERKLLGDTVEVVLTMVDGATQAELSNVLLVGEIGGIYQRYEDLTGPNPFYTVGGRSDANGVIRVPGVPRGETLGAHLFLNGYRYGVGRADTSKGTEFTVSMEPHLPEDVIPTTTDVVVTPNPVAPGELVTVTATVTAGLPCADPLNPESGCDPLSDEVVIVAPDAGWCVGMAPPSAGIQATGYPDGTWTGEFQAPDTPGDKTYYLVVSSEKCVTADRAAIPFTVQ